MWHTNNGDRTLEGSEAKLFAHAVWDLSQELEISEGDYDVDLPVFDRLTYGQKVSLLAIVCRGLLIPKVPIRNLTAVVECAVAAVFEFIKIEMITEIDESDNETSWRKLIHAARSEAGVEGLPNADCQYEKEWIYEIDGLEDMILWDNDFLDEDLFIDAPPEEDQRMKDLMRVRDDYFLDIADDPRPKEIEHLLIEIEAICRGICKESG